MKALTFTVYGKPVAKGRPRMTKSGHVYGDDSQIVDLVVTKRYDCEDAFAIVTVKEVEHD